MADITVAHDNNFRFVKDGSVDFVLTDPPFNISKETNFHTYEKNSIHSYKFDAQNEEQWDTYTHEEFLQKLDEWSAEWSRVLKKGGNFAIFCADAYISHLMEALKKNNLAPRRLITWRKNNAVPVNRAYMPMSANEYIIVGVKKGKTAFNADVPIVKQSLDHKTIEANIVADKAATIIHSKIVQALLDSDINNTDALTHIEDITRTVAESLKNSEIDVQTKVEAMYKLNKEGEKYLQACVPNYIQNPLKTGNRIHPTEKPVALLKYLIALYSNEGDKVLDGFGGSGSTAAAALELSRLSIIVEQDKNFYNNILERFSKNKFGMFAPSVEIIETPESKVPIE